MMATEFDLFKIQGYVSHDRIEIESVSIDIQNKKKDQL